MRETPFILYWLRKDDSSALELLNFQTSDFEKEARQDEHTICTRHFDSQRRSECEHREMYPRITTC